MDDLIMIIQNTLKKIIIILLKTSIHWFYLFVSFIRKTDKNKVVFVLSRSKTLDGNLKYIHDELLQQQPSMNVLFMHTTNKVSLKIFNEILALSNASYLILDDYYLPIYIIKPKKHLKVIQLWHAAGAFKKFGYSTINTTFGPSSSYLKLIPIHSNYTHVYVSSSRIVPYYAEAFNMSSKRIFPYGPPRIDLFNNQELIDEIKGQIKSKFPPIEKVNRVNVLVAPTYRATGSHQESNLNFVDIIIQISSQLEDHIQLIFKEHPYHDQAELLRLQACKNIILSPDFSVNDWMLVADALVTDYSSAVFDFSILHRPIAHYVTDIEEYSKSRGLYEEIEIISDGDVLKSKEKLITWINARKKNEHYNTERMIAYNFDHTKNVSSKIVSHFTRD